MSFIGLPSTSGGVFAHLTVQDYPTECEPVDLTTGTGGIMRCLKRYVAREVYPLDKSPAGSSSTGLTHAWQPA